MAKEDNRSLRLMRAETSDEIQNAGEVDNLLYREDRYKLIYFDNTHLHENEQSILISTEFKYKLFLKELELQDKSNTIQQFLQLMYKKYAITEKDFRYFFANIQEKKDQEMKSLLNYLKENKGRVWMRAQVSISNLPTLQQFNFGPDYPSDPEFFMFSLGYMQENCKNFNKTCSINIIPGFVSNVKNTPRKWEIIIFSGLNYFNDLVPFAIAFLDEKEDSIQLLTCIIQKFINIFNISPDVIFTPYSQQYADLISNFRSVSKLNCLHLYDALCHIDTVGQQLGNISDRIYYQDVILSKTKHQFRQKCEVLLKKVEPTPGNMEIFNRMVQIAPKMCFGLIETHFFIGLTFRHSANKYALNLMRQIFTKETMRQANKQIEEPKIVRRRWKNYQPTLTKSAFLIARAALRYNKDITEGQAVRGGYCQWRGENYLGLPQIENIRINIKKEFLDLLLEQYGKIFQMEAAQRPLKDASLKDMKTFDIYDKKLKSIFVVSVCPEYNAGLYFTKFQWRCNCCYSLKCGLPCAHEIKVAIITDTSLFDQIDQLWLKKRVYGENLKRRGRTKGTRRNTEK